METWDGGLRYTLRFAHSSLSPAGKRKGEGRDAILILEGGQIMEQKVIIFGKDG
jgi:hypothetical protein